MRKIKKPIIVMPLPIMPFDDGNPGGWTPPDDGD